MYLNTFIELQENISGYGRNSKKPSGHTMITMPGMIRVYAQDLKDLSDKQYICYVLSKNDNRAIRLGAINTPSESKMTNFKIDINNVQGKGIRADNIDCIAIVVEGDKVGNTDTIMVGYVGEKYLITPMLEKALPKKEVAVASEERKDKTPTAPPKQTKVEPKIESKPEPKVEKKAEPKPEPKVEVKVEKKVEPKPEPKVEVEVEKKMEPKPEPKVEVKVEKKVEPKPEPKPIPKVEVIVEPKLEVVIEPKLEVKVEKKVEAKPEPKAEVKVEKKVETKPEPKAEVKVEKKVEAKPEPKAEVKVEKKAEVKPEPKAEVKVEKKIEIKPQPKVEKKEVSSEILAELKSKMKMQHEVKVEKKPEPKVEKKVETQEECKPEVKEVKKEECKCVIKKECNEHKHEKHMNKECEHEKQEQEECEHKHDHDHKCECDKHGHNKLKDIIQRLERENNANPSISQNLEGELKELINQGVSKAEILNKKDELERSIQDLINNKLNNTDEDSKLEDKLKSMLNEKFNTQYDINRECKTCKNPVQKVEEVEEKVEGVNSKEEIDFLAQLENKLKGLQSLLKATVDNEGQEIQEVQDNIKEETKPLSSATRQEEYQRVKEIFETSSSIKPFENQYPSVDWVRISLAELISIPQLSYEWATQPFITFSYHKFNHLILGKDKEIDQYYIGIPDIYKQTRGYILDLDKIERFVCRNSEKLMIGEPGYWIAMI